MRDMNKIKSVSKAMAGLPPSGEALSMQHPFIESSIFNGKDIFKDENAFEEAVENAKAKIDACRKPKEVMNLVRPINREFWFAMCKDYMTPKEASELMGLIKTRRVSWLKGANKRALMTKQEYAVYKKLPKVCTMYECDGAYVRNKDRASAVARGKGENQLLMVKVKKEDVLVYYNRAGEDLYIIDGSNTVPVAV